MSLLKKNGKIVTILVLVILCVILSVFLKDGKVGEHVHLRRKEPCGLFIWDLSLEKKKDVEKLSNAVSELGINEIYYAFHNKHLGTKPLEKFVKEMKKQHVDTWYLAGDASWGLYPEAEEVCSIIDELAAYNNSVKKESRFTGIVLDIEPYSLAEWKEDKHAVLESWCQALIRAKQYASENGLLVTICIPRWLNEHDYNILEKMIKEGCDRVAVMNYGRNNEVEKIAEEIEIADRYQKTIIHISELDKPGQNDLTEDLTYYNLGFEAVADSWKNLKKHYPESELHFAFHHLEPLLKMMEK